MLENVLIKEHMHTIVNMEHSGVHVMLGNDKVSIGCEIVSNKASRLPCVPIMGGGGGEVKCCILD